MDVGDRVDAIAALRRVNYYRLSGYWYPFRRLEGTERRDDFYPGTRLADVVALYDFDARLRAATFSVLAPIELALRALLGHELGRIDPCVHLEPRLLGPRAQHGDSYPRWLRGYQAQLRSSREDFVAHHDARYGGTLPVWAAVEVLDWGGLTYLFGFAPRHVQDEIATACGLRAPQLESWLKTLNLLRNTCAHHGRLFNKVHTLSPRLPAPGLHPDLDAATTSWNRTFGQLTLIQFLLERLRLGRTTLLPAVVRSFPLVRVVPLTHLGAHNDWQEASALWST
ncbi:Abi family protein [Jiangella anatolica]|uniref:CAAX protease n=1 Tax=Jiangella anatolica TaxID=2670374 RepID=A0A2W2BI63_9ACTN|nr:CAAX protease [Jiangella anatolica]